MKIRAKFRVKQVNCFEHGNEVSLEPVTSGSDENENFFHYTPYGEIKMGILDPQTALTFKPGAEMYVDFSPADSE